MSQLVFQLKTILDIVIGNSKKILLEITQITCYNAHSYRSTIQTTILYLTAKSQIKSTNSIQN